MYAAYFGSENYRKRDTYITNPAGSTIPMEHSFLISPAAIAGVHLRLLVNPYEVVIHEVKRNGVSKIFNLRAESAC